MLATQHLASSRGFGRNALADTPKLPPVSRPRRLAVNNSASISAPLAPITEEQTLESRNGIDKIKAITSGETPAIECVDAARLWSPSFLASSYDSYRLLCMQASVSSWETSLHRRLPAEQA